MDGRPFTGAGYYGAFVENEFWRAGLNTGIICFFVVLTSLTFGTLGGYALSRSGFRYTFWLLIAALIFRERWVERFAAWFWLISILAFALAERDTFLG